MGTLMKTFTEAVSRLRAGAVESKGTLLRTVGRAREGM